ncbi:MAG: hypothetical protein C4576_21500 [Desulfobacteraceae bacterium]|nr:MAG: hypothetical protein C4576_21500 [Desulfobacteraceae bacterium]
MDTLLLAILSASILPFFLIFFLRKPDLTTVMVIGMIFSNVFVLAKNEFGLPEIVAASPILLFTIPLVNHLIIKREKMIFDYPFLLMLLFVLVLLSSSIFAAADLSLALVYLLTYSVEGLFLYFVIINTVRDLPTLRHIIWVILLCGALLSSLALYQEATRDYKNDFGGLAQRDTTEAGMEEGKSMEPSTQDLDRAKGPVGEPNRWAQILTVLLPLGLFGMWRERTRFLKTTAGIATILVFIGVLLTYSRGAILAIAALVLMMTLLRYIKIYQVSIVLAVMVGLVVSSPKFMNRLDTIRGVEGLISEKSVVKPDNATKGRLTEMLASSYAFLDHPVLGVGPAQYLKVHSRKYMSNPEIALRHITNTRRAHCLYTELAAETGMIGLTVFLAIVGLLMTHLWKLRRSTLRSLPAVSGLVTSLWLSIAAYMTTAIFLHLAYQRYFWLLLALSGAAVQIASSEAARQTSPAEGADPEGNIRP